MGRFETEADLRKEVERRAGPLSAIEWDSVAPSWSPPYDDADLDELLRAAEGLPSQASKRLQDFTRDIMRLRRQIQGQKNATERKACIPVGDLSVVALCRAVAERHSPPKLNDKLNDWYSCLGRVVHICLAADYLAKRHRVDPESALLALQSSISPRKAFGADGDNPSAALPFLSRHWARQLRSHHAGRGIWWELVEEYRRPDLRRTNVRKFLTDVILTTLFEKEQRNKATGNSRTWNELLAAYEGTKASFRNNLLRSFSNWRAFRVATLRAVSRGKQLE